MAQDDLDHASPTDPPRDATAPAATGRIGTLILTAGVLAGLVAGLCGERVANWHKPRRVDVVPPMGSPSKLVTAATEAEADVKNGALANAIMGLTFGIAMGLAGGAARRSLRASLAAGLAGLALGGASAYAASIPLLRVFPTDENVEGLWFPVLVHGTIWAIVGAVGGLVFGVGRGIRGSVVRAVFGGLIGGFLGAAIYNLAGASIFPLERTASPISISTGARVLAHFSVCIAGAACIAIALQVSTKRTAAPGPAGEG